MPIVTEMDEFQEPSPKRMKQEPVNLSALVAYDAAVHQPGSDAGSVSGGGRQLVERRLPTEIVKAFNGSMMEAIEVAMKRAGQVATMTDRARTTGKTSAELYLVVRAFEKLERKTKEPAKYMMVLLALLSMNGERSVYKLEYDAHGFPYILVVTTKKEDADPVLGTPERHYTIESRVYEFELVNASMLIDPHKSMPCPTPGMVIRGHTRVSTRDGKTYINLSTSDACIADPIDLPEYFSKRSLLLPVIDPESEYHTELMSVCPSTYIDSPADMSAKACSMAGQSFIQFVLLSNVDVTKMYSQKGSYLQIDLSFNINQFITNGDSTAFADGQVWVKVSADRMRYIGCPNAFTSVAMCPTFRNCTFLTQTKTANVVTTNPNEDNRVTGFTMNATYIVLGLTSIHDHSIPVTPDVLEECAVAPLNVNGSDCTGVFGRKFKKNASHLEAVNKAFLEKPAPPYADTKGGDAPPCLPAGTESLDMIKEIYREQFEGKVLRLVMNADWPESAWAVLSSVNVDTGSKYIKFLAGLSTECPVELEAFRSPTYYGDRPCTALFSELI